MPSVNSYQAFPYKGFPGGLNRNSDASRLTPQELAIATNVKLGSKGEVQLRTGYTRHDSNLVAAVEFMYPWRTAASVDHMLVVDASGDLFQDLVTDGAFTDSTYNMAVPAAWQDEGVGFAGAEGKVYVSSKTMSTDPLSFDGTSWATVSGFPKAKSLRYRHGLMYAINTSTRESGVLYSNLLDAETWTAEDYLEVDPSDGYEINASHIYGDDLVLFKDHAVWKLSGRTPSSFGLYRVDSLRGTVASRGVAQLRGLLYFIDRDTGIWSFDGAQLNKVSEPLNDYIKDNQDYDNGHKASAYSAGNRIYFSIPWTGGTNKMFCYFDDVGAWTEYDGGFNDSVDYLNDRWMGLPSATGIYKADTASKLHPPSGTDIEGTLRTGWLRVGGPGAKARIRRLEAVVDALDGATVTVNMYRDYDPTTVYKTQTFTGGPRHSGSATDERIVGLDGWANRIQAVQFEVVTSDPPFSLSDMTIFFSGGPDIRGLE